jgi:TAG lipase/steryl ester hydrolase/phospholipase A2/LPA acyltransferase
MRTASADKFINFIQNLEIDSEFDRVLPVEDDTTGILSGSTFPRDPHPTNSSRVTTPDRRTEVSETESCNTGIAVPEGDLLQPEGTTSGILLNFVRREDMFAQRNRDADVAESSVPEAYVDRMHLESGDAVSASDSDSSEDSKDVADSNNPLVSN